MSATPPPLPDTHHDDHADHHGEADHGHDGHPDTTYAGDHSEPGESESENHGAREGGEQGDHSERTNSVRRETSKTKQAVWITLGILGIATPGAIRTYKNTTSDGQFNAKDAKPMSVIKSSMNGAENFDAIWDFLVKTKEMRDTDIPYIPDGIHREGEIYELKNPRNIRIDTDGSNRVITFKYLGKVLTLHSHGPGTAPMLYVHDGKKKTFLGPQKSTEIQAQLVKFFGVK